MNPIVSALSFWCHEYRNVLSMLIAEFSLCNIVPETNYCKMFKTLYYFNANQADTAFNIMHPVILKYICRAKIMKSVRNNIKWHTDCGTSCMVYNYACRTTLNGIRIAELAAWYTITHVEPL